MMNRNFFTDSKTDLGLSLPPSAIRGLTHTQMRPARISFQTPDAATASDICHNSESTTVARHVIRQSTIEYILYIQDYGCFAENN